MRGSEAHRDLLDVLSEARRAGFVGPGGLERAVDHALGFARVLAGSPSPGVVADLGSGGGIPGLVLAWHWPESNLVLLESSVRRAAFLRTAVARLGFTGRVVVRAERAEVSGRDESLRGTADLVVARGFGPPAVTAECGSPLLRVGGTLVVSNPPLSPVERWSTSGLAILGLRRGPPAQDRYSYEVLSQAARCPDRFPRPVGKPAKRPLF